MSSITQAVSIINHALQGSANARLVYGEPIKLEGKVALPVAKITFGFGEGGVEIGSNAQVPAEHSTQNGGGGGGGGGMIAHPVGIFEITEKETRFIAASNKAVWGLSLVVAFMLGSVFTARKVRP